MLARLLLAASLSAAATVSFAQSMSPMRGEISSFTDSFAVKVYPANPYDHRIDVAVKVYDQNFRPVVARVSPENFKLSGGSSRSVIVVVPFDGNTSRKIRICTESVPFPGQQTQIRAQICGRFFAQRRS